MKKKRVFIVSGVSGSGKSTLVEEATKKVSSVKRVITTTTRPKRPFEKEGIDYYFVTENEFSQIKRNGGFLETNFHHLHWYGTSKQAFFEVIEEGKNPVLIVEPNGAENLRKQLENFDIFTIFIMPESLEEAFKRREQRDQENDPSRNLESAEQWQRWKEYDIVILNHSGKIEKAVEVLAALFD